MGDKAWKQFEREMGKLIGGTRFWANSGESVDCEGPIFLAQCKHVKSMSLNVIADLAEQAYLDGKRRRKPNGELNTKLGLVGIKTKPGRGKKSKTIVVMNERVFKELFPTGGGK